jgi:hypothetical protein
MSSITLDRLLSELENFRKEDLPNQQVKTVKQFVKRLVSPVNLTDLTKILKKIESPNHQIMAAESIFEQKCFKTDSSDCSEVLSCISVSHENARMSLLEIMVKNKCKFDEFKTRSEFKTAWRKDDVTELLNPKPKSSSDMSEVVRTAEEESDFSTEQVFNISGNGVHADFSGSVFGANLGGKSSATVFNITSRSDGKSTGSTVINMKNAVVGGKARFEIHNS